MDKNELKPEVLSWIEEHCLYPTDSEGYCIGFDPFVENEFIVDAFNVFGFVVISNVISNSTIEDCKLRVQSWYNFLSDRVDKDGIKAVQNGFIECYHDNFLAQARTSYRFYTAHSLLWKTSRLWCTFDRISYKQKTDEPNYSTSLHVNQNPLKHPKLSYTHGYISIAEEPFDNGNLRVVTGSQKYFDTWRRFSTNDIQFLNLNMDENPYLPSLEKHSQLISVKPGDGIIWDSRLVHSSTINKLQTPRISILVSYMPAILQENIRQNRVDAYVNGIPQINRSARLNASQLPRFNNNDLTQNFRIIEDLDRFGRLLYGLEAY